MAISSPRRAPPTRDVVGATTRLPAPVVNSRQVSVLEITEPADAAAKPSLLAPVCGDPRGVEATVGRPTSPQLTRRQPPRSAETREPALSSAAPRPPTTSWLTERQ